MDTAQSRLAFFDQIADRWLCKHRDHPRLEEVVRYVGANPGQIVLDLAAGPGLLSRLLAEKVGTQGQVISLDFSFRMTQLAREQCSGCRRVLVVRGDAQVLPLDNAAVDRVVMCAALPHFPDWRAALAEAARVLKPTGRLVIVHLLSSSELREVHRRAGRPVTGDLLPPQEVLLKELLALRFGVTTFRDEPGLYLVQATKLSVS
jgi:ubiquinone/menaquinone biosynthesis C-methylase UbiE